MGDLSPNFSRAEAKCRHCGRLAAVLRLPDVAELQPGRGRPVAQVVVLVPAGRAFLDRLERTRKAHYPKGLVISSWYRCPTHNRAVGGKPDSWHLTGLAVDFREPRMTLAQAKALGWRGIGVIRATGLVLHVDARPTPTVWYYEKNGNTP